MSDRPRQDELHLPYEICFPVNWWNHGLCSVTLVTEAVERVGQENVRVDDDGVMWVWEKSPVSSVRWPDERAVLNPDFWMALDKCPVCGRTIGDNAQQHGAPHTEGGE